jgi:geranylgeranyl pyrophosphate synthase
MEKVKMNLEDIIAPICQNLAEFEDKIISSFNRGDILVDQISKYALLSGGKRLRPSLVFLFAGLTGEIKPSHTNLALAVELIHNATLIHDDIIDDADKRHNQPSVHSKWNAKTAVLAGDYLLAKALDFLVSTNNNAVLSLFTQITQNICSAEIDQMFAQEENSVESYIFKAKRKTSMLFSLCTQGACLLSENSNLQAAENYANNIGIAFQIIDDMLPFQKDYDEKTIQADFKNKTITLPVLLALESNKELDFSGDFANFRQQVIQTKAIDKCHEFALKYIQTAIQDLNCFEDNKYKKSLCDLAQYIVDREF